jgi:hypothetical protein
MRLGLLQPTVLPSLLLLWLRSPTQDVLLL